MRVTHCHPFLIQAVCKHIIEILNDDSRNQATIEVLRLVAQDLTNAQIAERLIIAAIRETAAPFFFAVHAPFASPKGRQKAHELQKTFPVAAGDCSQGRPGSFEREYCLYSLKSPE